MPSLSRRRTARSAASTCFDLRDEVGVQRPAPPACPAGALAARRGWPASPRTRPSLVCTAATLAPTAVKAWSAASSNDGSAATSSTSHSRQVTWRGSTPGSVRSASRGRRRPAASTPARAAQLGLGTAGVHGRHGSSGRTPGEGQDQVAQRLRRLVAGPGERELDLVAGVPAGRQLEVPALVAPPVRRRRVTPWAKRSRRAVSKYVAARLELGTEHGRLDPGQSGQVGQAVALRGSKVRSTLAVAGHPAGLPERSEQRAWSRRRARATSSAASSAAQGAERLVAQGVLVGGVELGAVADEGVPLAELPADREDRAEPGRPARRAPRPAARAAQMISPMPASRRNQFTKWLRSSHQTTAS